VAAVSGAPRSTARLFIALWPSPTLRQALAVRRDAWDWPGRARPVPTERLHLTLHFLGDVPRLRLAELTAGLRVAWRAFDLLLVGAEVWRNGVAVLRPVAPPAALLQLHASLGDALQRLALPFDARAFRPHVTLARHAHGAALAAQDAALRWRVRSYVLVESLPQPVASYRVLQRYA
jgi:2'-5' RNA ligase